ncbi:MAG: Uma2 family endonuclease [Thermoflexibacter sp.]|jgi:Uma2 family endonuclease|nr:Uma2 family endonuclease [Thermoflexibacter sp.]
MGKLSTKNTFINKLQLLPPKEQKYIADLVDLLWEKSQPPHNGNGHHAPVAHTPAYLQSLADQYPKDKLWTFSDLAIVFPFEYKVKVEIINNQLYIMPTPTPEHQEITGEIYSLMKQFVKENSLGKVFIAPLEVVLDENNVLQPDILFVSEENKQIIGKKRIEGVPDIVVEVISPANYKKKREDKTKVYEKFGVKEYWEVKPNKKQVKIETLENGKFEAFSEAKKEGNVFSKLLNGFKLAVESIF